MVKLRNIKKIVVNSVYYCAVVLLLLFPFPNYHTIIGSHTAIFTSVIWPDNQFVTYKTVSLNHGLLGIVLLFSYAIIFELIGLQPPKLLQDWHVEFKLVICMFMANIVMEIINQIRKQLGANLVVWDPTTTYPYYSFFLLPEAWRQYLVTWKLRNQL